MILKDYQFVDSESVVSVQGNQRSFRFFVYEVTSTKFTREVVKEILISLVASVFMGLGTMFLLLWVGIYV